MSKKIFISHAKKDKHLIDLFVDDLLIGVLQIKVDDIFYTSGDGTKIKSGDDWRESIKTNLLQAEVIFLFISPYYKESEMCLCEMGAAWSTDKTVIPVIILPINYKTVGVVYEPTQIEKILDEDALERFRDILQEKLEIPTAQIKSDRWAIKRRKFLLEAKDYLSKNPYPSPLTRDTLEDTLKEIDELENTSLDLLKEVEELKSLNKDLEKAKDAEDVKAIKSKHKPSALFEEFEELCNDIYDDVFPFEPIIRGMIYKSFNGKQITVDWQQGYRYDLENADANNFIKIDEEDGSVDIDWDTTQEMKTLNEKLNHLNEFMEGVKNEDFTHKYKEKFSAPFRIDNKAFWNHVLKLPLFLT